MEQRRQAAALPVVRVAPVRYEEAAAREYSESLGMIGAGWWRQVAWAHRQGIPAALGMTTKEWVQEFVGGWARLPIGDRRAASSAASAVAAGGANATDAHVPLPTGRYRCIVIDPPWPMAKITRHVRPRQGEALDYAFVVAREKPEIAAVPAWLGR